MRYRVTGGKYKGSLYWREIFCLFEKMRATNTFEIKKASSKNKMSVTVAKFRVNCLEETAELVTFLKCWFDLMRCGHSVVVQVTNFSYIQLSVVNETFTCYILYSYLSCQPCQKQRTSHDYSSLTPQLLCLQERPLIAAIIPKVIYDLTLQDQFNLSRLCDPTTEGITALVVLPISWRCSSLSLLANPTNNLIFLVITFETLSSDKREDTTAQFCYPVILSVSFSSVTFL